MRIDWIKIQNFKNFSEISLRPEPGVNLFVGSNGSGKTAVLEAINVALGGFFGSQEQKLQRPISFEEIRIANGKRVPFAKISATSDMIFGDWSRTIKTDTKSNDSKFIKPASEYGEKFFKNFNDQNDQNLAPLICYYSTQRLFKDASQSGKQVYDAANGRRNGYLQCLKDSAIKGVLNEWLGNAATRRATKSIQGIDETDIILENVEKTTTSTLKDFLYPNENISLKIFQDPDFDNELYIHFDNEHNLPLAYYSDGFRNILYLVIDMVWRASQLNPWLDLDAISNNVNGVVTIDEIDLHLHPRWQAVAIGLIQKLFPKVQFFISTHSPIVVSNYQNGSLYVLNDNAIEKYEDHYFGHQINNVLRNVLGAPDRHIPTQRKLDTLFDLIDDGKKDEYEALLKELIDLLGLEDADINKAMALIAWQEELNKEQHAVHP